jgi:leucine carboxyl methyltransferase
MEEGQPSVTSMTAARQRAAHMLRDDAPKIFQDPLALRLSGVESESALQATLGAKQEAHARRSTPEVAEANYRCAAREWSCDSDTRKTRWPKL